MSLTAEQIAIYKAMSPADKLELGLNFCHAARALKADALRVLHPDWSEDQVQQQVRKIFIHAAN